MSSTEQLVDLPSLNRVLVPAEPKPERVILFGTGGFLRGFAMAYIDEANKRGDFNGSAVMIQSTDSTRSQRINEQDGLYTLLVKGVSKGEIYDEKTIITSVSRALSAKSQWSEISKLAQNKEVQWIITNTTEKGLTLKGENEYSLPVPHTFPGKLCKLLHERYTAKLPGCIILPCELISDNAIVLKNMVLEIAAKWNYEEEFIQWINLNNTFCSTLVDRIIPGDPSDSELESLEQELAYRDKMLTISEKYRLWAIAGDEELRNKIPFIKNEPSVYVQPDISVFAVRKLRLLNATHTIMIPYQYLKGKRTVVEMMEDKDAEKMAKQIVFDEVSPVLQMPLNDAKEFASEVLDRFRNPFIKHELSQIAFQSSLKWGNRVFPLLHSYVDKFGEIPEMITKGFAGLLVYNRIREVDEMGNNWAVFKNHRYVPADEAAPLYKSFWSGVENLDDEDLVKEKLNQFLSDNPIWNEDLSLIHGFSEKVVKEMKDLYEN